MAKPLGKNGTDMVDIGWRVRAREFTDGFQQDVSQFNVSPGIYKGLGPRYGMTPLPGHDDQEVRSGGVCNGIAAAETASGVGAVSRVGMYGIFQIKMTPYNELSSKITSQGYVGIYGTESGGINYVDAAFFSTLDTVYKYSFDIASGLAVSTYRQDSPLLRRHKTEQIQLGPAAAAIDVAPYLAKNSKKFIAMASISVAGKRIPYNWMVASALTSPVPSATVAPHLNLWTATYIGSSTRQIFLGTPSEFVTNKSADDADSRNVFVFCYKADGALASAYSCTASGKNIFPVTEYGAAAAYRNMTVVGATATNPTDYPLARICLAYDTLAYHYSSYNAVLMCLDRPMAMVSQDWLRGVNGLTTQWIDLAEPQFLPRNIGLESNRDFESAFWDSSQLTETGADTGILRKGITYDIGLSYYCKRLDFESNVAFGVSKTIVDDMTALNVVPPGLASGETLFWKLTKDGTHIPSWEYTREKVANGTENPRSFHINDWELRFYYRQQGMQEWVPGFFIDASKYWFYPFYDFSIEEETAIGAKPVAGLIGGRAGGFIDYSPLPKQQYNCCLIYRNRAFWFTDKSLHFSLKDNIFAYPANNVANATDGTMRGGIVHIQLGETEQQSWLIIFGSKSTYSAKFTGSKVQAQISVSTATVGQFDIDGSDFEIDHLCAATAYSYRAAVVADGVLFFWGPQGIYRHDGTGTPVEISQSLRPDILDLVNPNQTDEVHCVYNKTSKEVVWFYTPRTPIAGYETLGLVMHTETLEFFNYRWKSKIDASQNLTLTDDTTNIKLGGERTLIIARQSAAQSIQRPYLFDQYNRSGDMAPGSDFVVKSFTSPTPLTRRFTFAAGFPAAALVGVSIGQPVAIHQANRYATSLTNARDFIGLVAGKGTGYVDVTLPRGLSWDTSATLTYPEFFPIYFDLNAIEWLISSRYWCPYGLNTELQFQYLFTQWRLDEWPSLDASNATYSLSWRTPIGGPEWAQDVPRAIRDNSDKNSQIYHPFFPGESQMTGQALKFRMSGRHLGSTYTLQYLQLEGVPSGVEPLKNFWE